MNQSSYIANRSSSIAVTCSAMTRSRSRSASRCAMSRWRWTAGSSSYNLSIRAISRASVIDDLREHEEIRQLRRQIGDLRRLQHVMAAMRQPRQDGLHRVDPRQMRIRKHVRRTDAAECIQVDVGDTRDALDDGDHFGRVDRLAEVAPVVRK